MKMPYVGREQKVFDAIAKNIKAISFIVTLVQRRRSLAVAAIVIFGGFVVRASNWIDISQPTLSGIVTNWNAIRNLGIAYVAAVIVLSAIWTALRRIPRFTKEEVGVLVAIETRDDVLKTRLRDDFITNLRNELKSVPTPIRVEAVAEYHSERINSNSTAPGFLGAYHRRSRSRLIIFGRAKERQHGGVATYCLQLEQSVSHRPIPRPESEKFAKEMGTSFPREVLIAANQEFFGFKVTSSLFGFAAKYILGNASIYSHQLDLALLFHRQLLSVNMGGFGDIPNLKELRLRARKLVAAEGRFLALQEYAGGRNLDKLRDFLDAAALEENNPQYQILLGIYHFLSSRSTALAKKATLEAKRLNPGDRIWAYNMAFLCAYEGDLVPAYKYYKIAFGAYGAGRTHIDCEEFTRRILEEEPEKFQLHYCLGMIYYHEREDLELAEQSFREFLKFSSANHTYARTVPLVESYLEKIDRKRKNRSAG